MDGFENFETEEERLLSIVGPDYQTLAPEDQARLQEMAAEMAERALPEPFVREALRSTAGVLRELREEEKGHTETWRQEHVRQFIEQNAVPSAPGVGNRPPGAEPQRRERKREERERLMTYLTSLLHEARRAHGRHEVKKTRGMLLKVDQREVRRTLGRDGEELCRQINTWLRSTAALF
jgi:cytochrome P450